MKAFVRWAAFLAVVLLLLTGRYSWAPAARPYSVRAFASSAYLLAVILPVLHGLVAFATRDRTTARVAVGLVGLFFSLPYRWLGLERWYYHRARPVFWLANDPALPPPAPDWLPAALVHPRSMPHEVTFFAVLLVVAVGCAVAYDRSRARAGRPGTTPMGRTGVFWLGVFVLLLVETWLHLSMRSPYLYLTHFERPVAERYWYLVYLFPNAKGAVNADYFVFRDLEEYFMAIPKALNTMLIRRPLPFYLSAQWSYFFAPYRVFLVGNLVLWFTACACAYGFARRPWGERVATYFALLVATGTGFIMYVAQPMSYLPGFATVMILVYVFDALVIAPRGGRPARPLLFGGVLGLGAMVYDMFAFFPFFLGYALVRRVPLRDVVAGLALAAGIYLGFLVLQHRVLGVEATAGNAEFIAYSSAGIARLIGDRDPGAIYTATVSFVRTYVGHLGNVFFVLPLVLAVLGLPFVRERGSADVVALLAIPSLLAVGFLHFGATGLGTNARFAYVAYPCVYLLAALFLAEVPRLLGRLRMPRLAAAAPWVLLLGVVVLDNVDAFGFPQPYFLFYYASGGHW